MILLARFIAITSLVFTGVTLLRPRSGWGRLLLFIPKLFAGSRIFFLGVFGFAGGILSYLTDKDLLALSAGILSAGIACRHILRIDGRARKAATNYLPNKQEGMLPTPWVLKWKVSGDVSWEKDIQIGCHTGTTRPILADQWRPPTSVIPTGTGIIYLHGSGWHYADKDFGTRHFFQHLANQGHVILDLAYTLAPEADLKGMLGDVKQAILWMKNQGAAFGVDPNQIVLMGGSAGGHLALLAAYTPNDPTCSSQEMPGDTSVSAVISYYGPPDLLDQYDRFCELPSLRGDSWFERWFTHLLEKRLGFEAVPVDSLLPGLLGGTPDKVPEDYRSGSPSTHVTSHCPPTLLLQGCHDFSGNKPAVERLHKALRDAGVESILFELPDTDHGFDLYKPTWSPAAQAGIYVTERFLASLT